VFTQFLLFRSLSCTVKKGGALSQKALEGVLVTKNEFNQTKSVSSKCSELDTEIPSLLGVSKAILENVIFCHQEDSLWPLSEPATLKKKFDDIFSSTRYTKVLDNLKTIRKEKDAQLKLEVQALGNFKDNRNKAVKVRKGQERLKKQISEAKGRIVKMDSEEMLTVTKNIESVSSQRLQMNHIESDIYMNRQSQENLRSNVTSISQGLQIYNGLLHFKLMHA
jgi:DNA repair protein RAD50